MINMNGRMYESQYEEAVVQLLEAEGWTYIEGDNLHRKKTDSIIEDDLRCYLSANYGQKLDSSDIDIVVANMKNISGISDYGRLRAAVRLYQEGYNYAFSDASKLPFHLDYIDYDHPKNNIYRVVNQFEYLEGKQVRIPDVLLFINGIPVCILELKNPTDQNATIRNAHTQITKRYRRDIFSLLRYCAMACISDGSNTRLGNVFADYDYYYAWKKVNNDDEAGKGIKELETIIKGAFSPERIIEIIRDYIYFPDPSQEGEEKEVEIVCRYPQFFAARKLRDHILRHLRSVGGDGKGGTYFGATGCGKTYTMLFLARQLAMRCKSKLGSPTILLIVDREDLENQAGKLFCKSKEYLADDAVEIFSSRKTLGVELSERKTGGFYITTIQKFSESTGLLSDRANIICMSDEAHRTQNNLGSKLKINDKEKEANKGAFISYGFAKYLRDALPNATYVGFTGTPIDETIHVFGEVVDKYTMRQSEADNITVGIKYDPRLARVSFNREQAELIEKYYAQCEDDGASKEDIDKSKKAMSSLQVILGDEDRLRRIAKDIITDYDKRCENKPDVLQKAMVTCNDRNIAYRLYKIMVEMRPEWGEEVKTLDESAYTLEQLEKMVPARFLNVVATRNKEDDKDMYNFLGDEEHRKALDILFKDDNSNFRIVIVVDMWITGFDCPPLTMLYNDKPLQKHTLIQTISRVNRKYNGKKLGYIIDYIGIREKMKAAMKKYGGGEGGNEPSDDDIAQSHIILQQELQGLKEIMSGLDFSTFFGEAPLARLQFLQTASEYILANSVKEKGKVSFETNFKGHVKRLRLSYDICNPAGALSDDETAWSQCFMGICSFLNKITNTHHDVESMNRAVEQMVKEAITCQGVESILNKQDDEDLFGDEFLKELDDMKMPNTKFQLLVQLLQKAIKEYSKTNATRAKEFYILLQTIIDEYNTRDKLDFANSVATDTVNSVTGVVADKVMSLSEKLIKLFNDLKLDKEEFKKLGITFEEKAFYDILVDLRNKHGFEYPDNKCIVLARKIKELIDDSSLYADWMNNNNIRNRLASNLTMLIYKEGYPPEWDDEIFEKVLNQVENFKENE